MDDSNIEDLLKGKQPYFVLQKLWYNMHNTEDNYAKKYPVFVKELSECIREYKKLNMCSMVYESLSKKDGEICSKTKAILSEASKLDMDLDGL